MDCSKCHTKMSCIYSVPVGGSRYRVYKCKRGCDDEWRETMEVPAPSGFNQMDRMMKRLEEGRAMRYGFIRRAKNAAG